MDKSETWNGIERRESWYSNKDIFEMVQGLRSELEETRRVVHDYNDIRKDLSWAVECINKIHTAREERSTTLVAIREWGGWVVALAVLLLKLWD